MMRGVSTAFQMYFTTEPAVFAFFSATSIAVQWSSTFCSWTVVSPRGEIQYPTWRSSSSWSWKGIVRPSRVTRKLVPFASSSSFNQNLGTPFTTVHCSAVWIDFSGATCSIARRSTRLKLLSERCMSSRERSRIVVSSASAISPALMLLNPCVPSLTELPTPSSWRADSTIS